MEGETTYTAADIPEWEARLASAMALPVSRTDEWTGTVPSPYPGIGRERRRLHLTVDALKAGLSVQNVFDGLLLDKVVVLATSTNKWRFARHNMSWQRYHSVEDVFLFARGGQFDNPQGGVPAIPEIMNRLHGLLDAMGMDRDAYVIPTDQKAAWITVRRLAIEHERIKAGASLPPTKPQLQTARILVNALGIAMPELPTRDAANRFSDAHRDSFTDAPSGGYPKAKGGMTRSGKAVRERPLPDYARLKRAQVPAAALLALGVSSVDHLVARVNALRELADKPYVTRPKFPSDFAKFRSLAGELLGAMRDPSDTSVPGQGPGYVPDVWFVTAENGRSGNTRAYDADTPLIDFVSDNLDLLPARQRIAMDRRFYLTGRWKGLGPLAHELAVSVQDAQTILDAGFHALGNVTGCWKAVGKAVMSSGAHPPMTLAEIERQDWTAGMPNDTVLAVAEKVADLRLVHVEGHGDYFVQLSDAEIGRFNTVLKSAYPRLTWQEEADSLLDEFHAMFGGRIDAVVRHILGYEIRAGDGSA